MGNRDLLIEGYLNRISNQFAVSKDIAFELFSIAAVLDLTFEEVRDQVHIQGDRDGGIDGVHFLEQGDHYVMYLFQCKNKKALKQKEIEKLKADFHVLFEKGEYARRPKAEHLIPRIEEYKQLSEEGYIIQPKLFFLYNGLNDDPAKGGNKEAWQAYHQASEGFEIWDAEAIYSRISDLIKAQSRRKEIRFVFRPVSSNITPRDAQALYTHTIQNTKSAVFLIEALELCKLVQEETAANRTYDFLFAENIRGYLGLRARANKRIAETLRSMDDAIYFPFLNNGITMICDELTIPSGPQAGRYYIPALNPVIVNGLQTTRVISQQYEEDPDSLAGVYVHVRLYETRDPVLIDKITDATNTQTPIKVRDKVSTKDFSNYAKEVFANAGIRLITKRGETFSPTRGKEYSESIHLDTVLKYWWATFYEEPEVARNSIGTVLEKIYDATVSESPLSKLFGGGPDSPVYRQLLLAFYFYRFLQSENKGYSLVSIELAAYSLYKVFSKEADQALSKIFNERDEAERTEKLDSGLIFIMDTLCNKLDISINHISKLKTFEILILLIGEGLEENPYDPNNYPYRTALLNYLKSSKSRFDLNNLLDWEETKNKVQKLVGTWL